MPNLFRGDRLVVLGRYQKGGEFSFRVRGRIAGQTKEHDCRIRLEENALAHGFVPALWAQRRVGFLLDEIRLKGHNRELAEEVMRLSRAHGIVTPWTSHLVLEDTVQLGRFTGSDDYFLGRTTKTKSDPSTPGPRGPTTGGPSTPGAGAPTAGPVGPDAITLSVALKKIREGTTVQSLGGRDETTRRVKDKVFFRVAEVWLDSALDAKTLEAKEATRLKVKAFSEEYFRILREKPELSPYFALGDRVIVLCGEQLIEVEAR
jgi:Ca-activated chloride channel family protein